MDVYLNAVARYLFAQSWQIAILAVIVSVGSLALRNRSAHIRYLLWLIVLAKCLVPPLYSVPVAVLPEQPVAERLTRPASAETRSGYVSATQTAEPVRAEAVIETQKPKRAAPNVKKAIVLVWLLGVFLFLAWVIGRAVRYTVWLHSRRMPLPPDRKQALQELFASLKLKTPPTIWLTRGIGQPFVWGLLRGSVYLPADFVDLDGPQFGRTILAHELSHVSRFDAGVNLLQVAAQAIYWFHPLVWWANKRIRMEREKCCDEMAVVHLSAPPEQYTGAIVEALATERRSVRPIPSLAIVGSIKDIEERIKTMLRPGKKFYKRPSLIASTTVLLVAFLTVPTALVLTARAQTDAPKPQAKTTYPLQAAARAGDIEKVKSLLAAGANVNEEAPQGWTALHRACENGHTEVARLLIERGADVNAMVDRGSPLLFAAARGDKRTVELLLSKGANINIKTRQGRTPLFAAMASPAVGSREVVELLVSKGAKIPQLHLAAYLGDMDKVKKRLQDGIDINSQEDFGCTALHTAANGGKKDIVEFLINKGADVDAKEIFGGTPLYYAAIHNYADVADLLLATGADVDAKDEHGFTLLYYAIWDESKDAVKLLLRKGAHVNARHSESSARTSSGAYTPLDFAIWQGDKDIVELLIAGGADVNAEDKLGHTPLTRAKTTGNKDLVELLKAKGAKDAATISSAIHLAADTGDLAKLKSLIEAGADVNAKEEKGGRTPLFVAGDSEVARFLIAQGANVNATDKAGWTPLHSACFNGNKNKVELLLAKGADINAKGNNGETPLYLAFVLRHRDLVELLLTKGADVNAKGPEGVTLLHMARDVQIATLLLAHGADVNAKGRQGGTPLHAASRLGLRDNAELLIAKGADVNARNDNGQTALAVATAQGHEDVVELLKKHGAKE